MKIPKPMIIIFIGAAITIIGAIVTAIGTLIQNRASSKKIENIRTTGENTNQNSIQQLSKISELQIHNTILSTKVDSLEGMSNSQINQIQQLTTQNADLSYQLSESTLKLSGNITGGDSFCELVIIPRLDERSAKLLIIHKGKFPLYDLQARIVDGDAFEKIVKSLNLPASDSKDFLTINYDPFKDAAIIHSIGNVIPGTTQELGELNVPFYGNLRSFNVFFIGRNGAFIELIRLCKFQGKWIRASRIIKTGSNEILQEFIDPEFPKELLKWQ